MQTFCSGAVIIFTITIITSRNIIHYSHHVYCNLLSTFSTMLLVQALTCHNTCHCRVSLLKGLLLPGHSNTARLQNSLSFESYEIALHQRQRQNVMTLFLLVLFVLEFQETVHYVMPTHHKSVCVLRVQERNGRPYTGRNRNSWLPQPSMSPRNDVHMLRICMLLYCKSR